MKKVTSNEIKNLCKRKHVPYWRIAIRLNTSESSVYRMLRQDLPQEKAEMIISVIDEIAKEVADGE